MTTVQILLFCLAALVMVLSPGPNMIYLISRSICQGRKAGVISLLGVIAGFVCHMLAAALGLTAIFIAQPIAYDVLKYAGALYLCWLAWQNLKPNGRSAFEARDIPPASTGRLFAMGLITNLLNPKIIVFYLSILPQFITDKSAVLEQSLILGMLQLSISFAVNLTIVLCAARLSRFLMSNPRWMNVQRRVMGAVLAGLAVKVAL